MKFELLNNVYMFFSVGGASQNFQFFRLELVSRYSAFSKFWGGFLHYLLVFLKFLKILFIKA